MASLNASVVDLFEKWIANALLVIFLLFRAKRMGLYCIYRSQTDG